jgi:hypothetical protein
MMEDFMMPEKIKQTRKVDQQRLQSESSSDFDSNFLSHPWPYSTKKSLLES